MSAQHASEYPKLGLYVEGEWITRADRVHRVVNPASGQVLGELPLVSAADLDRTMDILVAGKVRNAGQVCVSPTRFYVQEGIYDRFIDAYGARLKQVRVGDGLRPETQMGPMANPRRPQAMGELIQDAVSHGARLCAGGEAIDGGGYFWQPTLLADVPPAARIMREEPFGPVAAALPFSTLDDVLEQANQLPYGLAAFVFTENGRRANLASDGLEAGMVGVNTTTLGAADAPFGGVKDSGHGSEGGPEGLHACLVTKAIHQH